MLFWIFQLIKLKFEAKCFQTIASQIKFICKWFQCVCIIYSVTNICAAVQPCVVVLSSQVSNVVQFTEVIHMKTCRPELFVRLAQRDNSASSNSSTAGADLHIHLCLYWSKKNVLQICFTESEISAVIGGCFYWRTRFTSQCSVTSPYCYFLFFLLFIYFFYLKQFSNFVSPPPKKLQLK